MCGNSIFICDDVLSQLSELDGNKGALMPDIALCEESIYLVESLKLYFYCM